MREETCLRALLAAFLLLTMVWSAGAAAAATAEEMLPVDEVAAPEITNPAIRQIIQSRAGRVRELNRHKAAAVIGENNRALVEVRQLDALALQERAAVQKLVKAENADRERMFGEIANVVGGKLPKIQEQYAVTLREKARRGDWIQLPDGSWQRKEETLHHR